MEGIVPSDSEIKAEVKAEARIAVKANASESAKKRLTIGLLAHVDAGKTTLAEALLFAAGKIRKLGRVDHKDSFLDSDDKERERGITIFSKIAQLEFDKMDICLIDTPGHAELCAETERTLRVLDYAVLIINGRDGVQSHTETLFELLREYEIPCFIWVNKMDIASVDKEAIKREIEEKLSPNCVEFMKDEAFYESLALCSEELLEELLKTGSIDDEMIAKAVAKREVYPCVYGSALKFLNIDMLLEAIERFSRTVDNKNEFAAKIYKISRDDKGVRLTHMKLTGGSLTVREMIDTGSGEEKVNQIRLYDGKKYTAVNAAEAGMVVAVAGLGETFAGQSLGAEKAGRMSALSLGRICKIDYPQSVNSFKLIQEMMELEEEHPEIQLHINDDKEILVRIEGDLQLEILEGIILSRYGVQTHIEDYVPVVEEEPEFEEEEIVDDRIDLNARWMPGQAGYGGMTSSGDDELELQRIFEKTYGKQKEIPLKAAEVRETAAKVKKEEPLPEYLLVDGYNVIYAWEDLRELAKISIDAAREELIDRLCNYRSWTNAELIVVFDAYRVRGGKRRNEKQRNIFLVYTEEAESADSYIEKVTYKLRRKNKVRVVSSDVAEQVIIVSNNAIAVSAEAFRKEVDEVTEKIRQWIEDYNLKESLNNRHRIELKSDVAKKDTEDD